MTVDISAFERSISKAVTQFWKTREAAANSQRLRGVNDQGDRAAVTAGKNLDGFVEMVRQLIIDNGVIETEVFASGKTNMSIPGYYRPAKTWDLLVVSRNRLIAAIEFKSQVGPSFGNNFNNRVEEAIGNATDLNTAFREGVFGESGKPFVGYFFILEECQESTRPVRFKSPHFSAMDVFENTSYAQRYEIFCRRLVQESLYDAAALILSNRTAQRDGKYNELSQLTSARRFATTLAGKISGIAAE